ncbi:type II toxin-antitoxin system VapC family toxin [Rhizobium tumorigenes]|uniref:type II toxin-antitoxin system VapC family toxin n=1 Tax=Rhizobium tumorigenes TaxID=2041385 RepID=UPI00241CFD2D|nr:type II toxin-antitoxin system VapC family toxin [Rhizobium tumorigenes]WFS02803.1 type II toxin-antitoxin system VapC family toxin [Rhizobium tumorigenes]
MRVVDSSAWIEWLLDSATGQRLADEMPKRDKLVVPTIVQLELSKWLSREKGEEAVDQFFAFTATCIIAPLDTAMARLAAETATRHKLSIADAIIHATAETYDADILTCDAHFKGLARAAYVEKIS